MREALDAALLGWMGEGDWRPDEERFFALARELFAFQFEHCAPYRRFCERRGSSPARLRSWREIPVVPTGAFKELALRCFPAERTLKTFRTSGTATTARGELHLDRLELYEASLLRSFRRFLLPDLAKGARLRIRVLAPAPAEAPDSSLSHMFGVALRELGAEGSGFDVEGGELRADRCLAALEQASKRGEALLLCGTAFAFVHLLDALAQCGRRLVLPAGSRLMETGGSKGRARELAPGELHALLECALGVPAARIINQYGMTELASQFYDSVLALPGEPRRKLGPPWTRVRVVDPETGADARPGEIGSLAVYDLANSGSVLALQTADLGRSVCDGFELVGREPGAEARGCSIAADELLGHAPR